MVVVLVTTFFLALVLVVVLVTTLFLPTGAVFAFGLTAGTAGVAGVAGVPGAPGVAGTAGVAFGAVPEAVLFIAFDRDTLNALNCCSKASVSAFG